MCLRPCLVHGLDGASRSKALSSQGPRAFFFSRAATRVMTEPFAPSSAKASRAGNFCSPATGTGVPFPFLRRTPCLQQANSMRTDRSAFCSAVRLLRNVRSIRSLSYARCSAADRDSSMLSVTFARPAQRLSLSTKRSATMIDRYRKKIAAMVIQLAKDDPKFVKEMIQKLKRSGEIEVDDLRYLERIADRWIAITEKNLQKARR